MHTALKKNTDVREKILVVDDSNVVRRLLSDILTNQNYEVFQAADGEAALDIAAQEKPNLIFLDIVLPGIDGYQTCAALKCNPETRDIPVIFLTAEKKTSDDKVKGFDSGGVDFVSKPFDSMEIVARTHTHIQLASLTRKLQSYALKLQNSHSILEEQVAKRTSALRQANEALRKEAKIRKSAITALRKSEANYRNLFNNQYVAVSVTDEKGVFTDVNEAFCKLVGYTYDELCGVISSDELIVNQSATASHELAKIMSKGEAKSFKFTRQIRKKSGETTAVEVNGAVVYDDKGVFVGVVTCVFDLSRYSREWEETSRDEQIYRSIFESFPSPIAYVSLDGTFQKANDAFLELLQSDSVEIIDNLGPKNIIHPIYLKEFQDKLAALRNSGDEEFSMELEIVRPSDFEVLHCMCKVSKIKNNLGRLDALLLRVVTLN